MLLNKSMLFKSKSPIIFFIVKSAIYFHNKLILVERGENENFPTACLREQVFIKEWVREQW